MTFNRRRNVELKSEMDPDLSFYLNQLREVDQIKDVNVERALVKRAKRGDIEARNQLIESKLLMVASLSNTLIGRGATREELIAEGNLGLFDAIRKFDPKRNLRLSTYAYFWIKLYMHRMLPHTPTIRIPESSYINMRKYVDFVVKFTVENGYEPNLILVANHFKWRTGTMKCVQSGLRATWCASFAVDSDTKDSIRAESVVDYVKPNNDRLDDYVHELLRSLSERERSIIRTRFGFNDEWKTLAQIGEDYGVSKERIRQVEKSALGKLFRAEKRLRRRKGFFAYT